MLEKLSENHRPLTISTSQRIHEVELQIEENVKDMMYTPGTSMLFLSNFDCYFSNVAPLMNIIARVFFFIA